MVDYSPEKKSMKDYYKEFIGRGDEADRDRRTRRNKRIRTQKENKRLKERNIDLKKDVKDLKSGQSRLTDPAGKKLYGDLIKKRTDEIRKNQFKRAINLGKGAVKKVGPLGFISSLLSPTPAYKKGGKVK